MIIQWYPLILGGVITILAAGLRRFTGFGFAMVSVSFFSLGTAPANAVLATLLLQIFLGIRNLPLIVRDTPWRSMPWVVGAGLLATPVGLLIVDHVDEAPLRGLIGASILLALVPLIWRRSPFPRSGVVSPILGGFLGGLLNSLAAMPAPPLLLFLASQPDLSLEARRAALITIFTLLTVASLGGRALGAGMDGDVLLHALLLCPAAYLGDALGRKLPWSASRAVVDRVSYLVIAVTACTLFVPLVWP
ncbi:MAG: TSUP family transporter [Rhodospirillum sp.]|nr:TSUP family transporter [Rhodospirillum sp.]MCF8491521.1 TSUP family transporter [Rhodospirillum sp.]MCF8502150.1 TSUP family transporter [Rhodospirillum sp.]